MRFLSVMAGGSAVGANDNQQLPKAQVQVPAPSERTQTPDDDLLSAAVKQSYSNRC